MMSCLLVCYNITNGEIDDWRRDVGERGEALQAKMLGIFGKQPEPISAYALLDELKKPTQRSHRRQYIVPFPRW